MVAKEIANERNKTNYEERFFIYLFIEKASKEDNLFYVARFKIVLKQRK